MSCFYFCLNFFIFLFLFFNLFSSKKIFCFIIPRGFSDQQGRRTNVRNNTKTIYNILVTSNSCILFDSTDHDISLTCYSVYGLWLSKTLPSHGCSRRIRCIHHSLGPLGAHEICTFERLRTVSQVPMCCPVIRNIFPMPAAGQPSRLCPSAKHFQDSSYPRPVH